MMLVMLMIVQSQAIAQKLRRPLVIASSIPLYPSSEYALVTIRAKPFAIGFMNRLLHWAVYKGTSRVGCLFAFDELHSPGVHAAAWSMQGSKMINKFRAELELPPQERFQFDAAPWLNFYSDKVGLLTVKIPPCSLLTIVSVVARLRLERRTGPSSYITWDTGPSRPRMKPSFRMRSSSSSHRGALPCTWDSDRCLCKIPRSTFFFLKMMICNFCSSYS